MNGASREALAAARERLDALTDNTSVDAAKLADELAAVTALLDREVSLRRVLTDPAQPGEAKAELAGRLLGGQVGGETVDLVLRHGAVPLVAARATWWTRSRSWRPAPTSPPRSGPARSTTSRTSCSGSAGSSPPTPSCGAALTDRRATASAKSELLRSLLGGRAEPGHRASGDRVL